MHRSGLILAAWCTAAGVALAASPQATSSQQPQQPAAAQEQTTGSTTEQRLSGMQPPKQLAGGQPLHLALVTAAGNIASNPHAFYGARVSVHAPVAEAFSQHSFTLEDDQWWRFGDDVLVLVPRPQQGVSLADDAFVTVVGTVRQFVRAEMERDYDWFDFDRLPDLEIELEGRPVIIADLARTSDGAILAQPAEKVTHVYVATPGQIAATPGRFYGRNVVVRQEIEDVWSPRAFTLDEDNWFAGPDLLVFNPNPVPLGGTFSDFDGDQVTVFGTVRPLLLSEFDQDYDWFNLNDYERYGIRDWERRPAIVASSILTDERLELVSFQPELSLDRTEAALTARADRWGEQTARYDRQQRTTERQAQQPQPRQEQQRQAEPTTTATPPATGQTGPLRSIGELMVNDPSPLFGRQVNIDRVPVVRVIDDRTYAVGASADRSVTVRLTQAPDAAISVGDTVQVMGTVARPGGMPQISGPLYIDARQMSKVPQ